ncbi:bifunctional UDP-N-acetylglucosamine diphosphorylase/glucosamine-1-phosphate N-acetyltransferase GlmU [Fulvimarina sp. 2208YS6-2-32]|uniref:Bifunctional protein GlmU n=1 Tax=Fulvimarina uroteuthidis TaxID=3098149 RepID=A0ABU5I778_9HYPH|nr:bifunctional UDP-N-acetylglucosamine diphosphorylase/glucosamine-1-phosphate N-acetyltransferase GlmU [Fulvimarina sp. 2208YS6-2-32]MDY8110031.1 bifunctional UDP-N-acetylglucosamine diphosphorylase/glucosamine-1-phosphate N-acetyltransferase GlmU [Fulvimarina sp. 2208YS6-2-32]
MSRTCLSIILAAGEGTRMRSSRSKVLHEVGHLPLVRHVARAALGAGSDALALVVGRDGDAVASAVRKDAPSAATFEQVERRGTGHAVLAARDALAEGFDDVVVLFGDTPLLSPDTIARARARLETGIAVCVIGFRPSDPTGYGRLIEEKGELVAIREQKEASEAELRIGFCNAGIMAFSGREALSMLEAIGDDNAKGEYYLTDLVEIARRCGHRVEAIEAPVAETIGVNNRAELAEVEALWQARTRERVMLSGVTLIDPKSVHFAYDTQVGEDVLIEPNVVFGPGVTIAPGAVIHAFCHLSGAMVGTGAAVGPFARLRPGTRLGEGTKVGNFCEVKQADVAAGAKINHLSYIGDAQIGANANIGAGTITCNYDGALKHLTQIGANAFIGSNSALVAPVAIGDGAYVGSGSVITENVEPDALAIARGRQVNKPDLGRSIAERNRAAKAAKANRS